MRQELIREAALFIKACYSELEKCEQEIEQRIQAVTAEIHATGSYRHTKEELEYGAKAAWRNSNRCIGRLFWETLHIFDQRELNTEEEIAAALIAHIEYATNEGRIRPAISIFAAASNKYFDYQSHAEGASAATSSINEEHRNEIRIWNHQLLRYAGYETEEGVVGDPASAAFTNACLELGWKGEGTAYDLLPLVIQINNEKPKWFNIPKQAVKEVYIEHADFPAINELNMKWYAVPIVSDMRLTIGGIDYTAAPFNGWYMGTEIGSRNLADTSRYNMLGQVADAMGLDCKHASSLWKDRALVELNAAVLDSFKLAGVTIVDHHTAAAQFMQFEKKEASKGRDVTGRWSWLIPPLSPATTHIFHSSYNDNEMSPNYYYQDAPYDQ